MLTETQVATIRQRLIALPYLDQHSITELLAERPAVEPEWLICVLQDRVTHAETLQSLGQRRRKPMKSPIVRSSDNLLTVLELHG